MKSPIFLTLALAASTLSANAQSPVDTLQDVRPFSTHALDLLMAREPGVEVISSPGAPGMTPTIHIRGFGALPGINPVYIVDGLRRRDLDGIAPESIGKIEVLKDASAMGLYGPDAAAGVVVVTTKRATEKGFHAGYDFLGGFQALAHEPAHITFSDWKKYFDYVTPEEFKIPGEVDPETTFIHRHHLSAQYGGKRLSAYAGFSLLDNNGPYPGRADSQRRYAASWSAEYRPLSWLSLETTGWWSRSKVNQAPKGWLQEYLGSKPLYLDFHVNDKQYKSWWEREETALQGKLEIRPFPGMYLRGTGGYSQHARPSYSASWDREYQWVDAASGHQNARWYQWGAEAGWSGQWRDHRLSFDATFRRMQEKQDNLLLKGGAFLTDYGLTFGDDDHLVQQFLQPEYDIYLAAGGGLEGMKASKLNGIGDTTPEYKWKEGVLHAGYDYMDRYRVDFSYFRCWEEKLFSDEGYRVPSLTLGWSLSEEPWLRQSLPEWWKSLSVEASWTQPVPVYVPLLQPELMYSVFLELSQVTLDTRHRDLNAKASFQFGSTVLSLSSSWFIHDDGTKRHAVYYIYSSDGSQLHQEDDRVFNLRNQGAEFSASLQGTIGTLRYAVDGQLTFYRNRISFDEKVAKFNAYMPWAQTSQLSIKDGEPVGGMSYLFDEEKNELDGWGGCTFPRLTGGLRASLGWNRWQMTISGHGAGGQTILHTNYYDALTRYYLETLNLEPRELYSGLSFYRQENCILSAPFFRIDQLRLDYILPLKNVRLNLFASLENGILLTKYRGSDPELALAWEGLGVETATYPSTRRTIFGLSISF